MLRIAATMTKKVPLAGVPYGSVEVGARLEMESTKKETPEALKERFRKAYAALSAAVDEQLKTAASPGSHAAAPAAGSTPTSPGDASKANGNGTRGFASTQAQRRAVVSICRSQGLDLAAVLKELGVSHLDELTVRDASMLIDDLKSRPAPAG